MSCQITAAYLHSEYVLQKRSLRQLADVCGTNHMAIKRALQKAGIPLRTRGEAQRAAIEAGRTVSPTEGRERTEQEKETISEAASLAIAAQPAERRLARRERARKLWLGLSLAQRQEMWRQAIRSVRQTTEQGSALERYLCGGLRSVGYRVLHRHGLIVARRGVMVDLYLPGLKLVIDVRGPAHFKTIWGKSALDRKQADDKAEAAVLLEGGYSVLVVAHHKGDLSQARLRAILHRTLEAIRSIGSRRRRLVEITIT